MFDVILVGKVCITIVYIHTYTVYYMCPLYTVYSILCEMKRVSFYSFFSFFKIVTVHNILGSVIEME